MIADGAPVTPDCFGWLPIDQLPLATLTRTCDGLHVGPMMIEGVTTSGEIVIAVYSADGDYVDRWKNRVGTRSYRLTHGRPVAD